MFEFDVKAFNIVMERFDVEFSQELPEVKRFHAAALSIGGDMRGDNTWIVLAVALLGVDTAWEWRYLIEHTVKILPIYVSGFQETCNREDRFTTFWVNTTWDASYPIDVFAEIFTLIALEHKRCWSLPATIEYAKKIWDQEGAEQKKRRHARENANGNAFIMRPFMGEMYDSRAPVKHIHKDKARARGMSFHPAVNSMVQGQAVDKMIMEDIPVLSTRTGRTQSKTPNISNLPRGETKLMRVDQPESPHPPWSAEYLCQPSHISLETGKALPVYSQMGKKLFDVRLEGCGRLVTYGVDHGKFIQDEKTHDGFMFIQRGGLVKLIDSDGKKIGRAVIRGDGELDVLEEPMDIKIGKEFWFLAGQFDGDPVVAHGKVTRFRFSHSEELVKGLTMLWMRLKNGHETVCYDTDLYETREDADRARSNQLERMADDYDD